MFLTLLKANIALKTFFENSSNLILTNLKYLSLQFEPILKFFHFLSLRCNFSPEIIFYV